MPNGLGSWGEKRDAEIFLQGGCFWSKFATQISVSAPLHFFPNIFFVFSFKQEGEEDEEEEEEEEEDFSVYLAAVANRQIGKLANEI